MKIGSMGVFLILVAGLAHAQPVPQVVLDLDVVYSRVAGEELHIDIARPGKIDKPRPVTVCFHGGGWEIGNKASYRGNLERFVREGFVAASVQYRFAPKYPMPAQIEDAKCAVRFLRANAEYYGIDPDRIGSLGDSAGGLLALMVGVMNPGDGIEAGTEWKEFPSRVQAVASFYSAADMTHPRPPLEPSAEEEVQRAYGKSSKKLWEEVFGTADRSAPIYKLVSPVTYVSKGDPPVMIFQGSKDPIVLVEQAHILDDALKAAGVESRLEILEGAGHGWSGPERERTTKMAIEFFREKLNAPR